MPTVASASADVAEAAGAAAVIHGRASDYGSRLAWAKFFLVTTGVWWGICMQLIYYQGAGHPMAMLPNLDWYVGMMLVYVGRLCTTRDTQERYATVRQRHVIPIAICDYVGTVGTTVGLELSGSALFGIIYSSVTVWTALFTCLLLRKSQTPIKMAGILACVAGLALPTLDQAGEARADDGDGDDDEAILLGIALTLLGTLFYALEYTLCERAFTLYDRPVDSKQLCFYTGAWGLGFTCVWMAAYTVPRWDAIVSSQVAARHGSPLLLLLLFLSHTLNNGLHNAAWFVVCELESGVSTGLLMGLKAAALFLASALFFCRSQSPWPRLLDDHAEQCMTPTKTVATAVVLLGTMLYYWPAGGAPPCASLCRRSSACWWGGGAEHPGSPMLNGSELQQASEDDAPRTKAVCTSPRAVDAAAPQELLLRVQRLEGQLADALAHVVSVPHRAMPRRPGAAKENGERGADGESCRAAEWMVHGGRLHTSGLCGDPLGSVRQQTAEALHRLEAILSANGLDKSHLLHVDVWIADMREAQQVDAAYEEWLNGWPRPTRTCVSSDLRHGGCMPNGERGEPTAYSFAAGCIAGAAGQLVGHPLDTLKVHAQAGSASTTLLSPRILFRGVAGPVLTAGSVQALNLGVYENSRRRMTAMSTLKASPLLCHAISGATAGLVITPITCPLNLIKVLQQLRGGPWWATARAAVAERTLLVGLPATALFESSRGIYMLAYEVLKRGMRVGTERGELSLGAKSVAGAGANVITWAIIYPVDVIRSVQQSAALPSGGDASARAGGRIPGMIDCARTLYRHGGLPRIYQGFVPQLIRAGPVAGIILPLFELVLAWLEAPVRPS